MRVLIEGACSNLGVSYFTRDSKWLHSNQGCVLFEGTFQSRKYITIETR